MLQKTPSSELDRRETLVSLKEASLNHVNDADPGIGRKRAGKGVTFVDAKGKRISDKDTIARIKALVIPPAWTDVWISPDPDGHIQATGRDVRGRKQYRYHARWSACRDDVKFSNLVAFAQSLPLLRSQIDKDLRKTGVSRERVIASIIWLMDNTMIRVGNAVYARDNKSFGLTTLRNKHVAVEGSKLRFAFKGKSGKEWNIKLVDRRMAKIVRLIQELPGQHLFQYVGEDGERHIVRSQDVNDYIREASGSDFSSKHFRTWGGTVRAVSLFGETPLPATKTNVAKTLNMVIDLVAGHLGNTRAVCRKSYVDPQVIASWQAGSLPDELAAARKSRKKAPDDLDAEEVVVMNWLAAAGSSRQA